MPRTQRSHGPARPGTVRIIGGQWRGRKLPFPATEGLRPTPDRVRETLFNWLAPHIEGARCLDLFAGSGALGLEALSRGAQHCEFIDNQREATAAIAANLELLRCPRQAAKVHQADALSRLASPPAQGFDVVFLDPPYQLDVTDHCAGQLQSGSWLAPGAWIYLEKAAGSPPPAVPPQWRLHRDKTAGDVVYRLYHCE